MAIKRVKAKDTEKLDYANVERVIGLLEQPKPITKKEACEVLHISYNTTRLAKIIELHKEKKDRDEKRRAANRGKPASDQEVKDVINEYLDGSTVSAIAEGLYRSTTFVRNILDTVGVPQRGVGENYMDFSALPEQCISETFEAGEIAWSSRYRAACIVDKEMGMSRDGTSRLYRIYVIEPFEEPEVRYFSTWGKPGFYSTQPAYDIGRLAHLRQYGVDLERKINK
jgi:hypothetical protein